MSVDVVLFDLGGVLIDLGGVDEFAGFVGEDSEDEIWRRWLTCPWVRRFESGLCDPDSFARGMVDTWSMRIEPDEFLRAFVAWPRGWLPGAEALVRSISVGRRVGCLSNTNELHAARQAREFRVEDLFEDRFFSHEMGLLKPDRAAFDFVVETLRCPAERILFLGDNQINVDGARAAGLRSERVRGVVEAQTILVQNGLSEP